MKTNSNARKGGKSFAPAIKSLAIFSLALLFTASCSSDSSSGGGGGNPIKKDKISGFSQKGPFVRGSSVTLFELDSNLAQTGNSFQSTIADDKGSFEINGISLVSPYARLKTDGYYYNEASGKKSASPITLYAIADLANKNSMNVNLLTHLEHEKVQKLVESGNSVSNAKKQAQQEILRAFGIEGDFADSEDMSIFGSSEGSAILLAISILLQGERDEASFTDLLADFSQSIKNSSEWSFAKKTELADWALGTDLERIRANIVGWGLSYEVPVFEKYVRKFWSDNYGLGECKPANNGYVAKNANPLSANKDRNYVCNGSYWEDNSSSGKEPEINYANVKKLEVGGISALGSFVDLDGGVAYTVPQVVDNASKIDIVYAGGLAAVPENNRDRIYAGWEFGEEFGNDLSIYKSLAEAENFTSLVPLSALANAATVAASYDILTGAAQLTEAILKSWKDIAPGGARENEFYIASDYYGYIDLTTNKVFAALTSEGNFFVIAVDTANERQSISIAYYPVSSIQ